MIEPCYPKGKRGHPPMGIDFMTESVPDKTTLCEFRHLLEEHGLNKLFFDASTGGWCRPGTC